MAIPIAASAMSAITPPCMVADMLWRCSSICISTSKFVQDKAPKVSATIDETLEKTSETFKRTMNTIDAQTKTQQIKLLRAYRSFLSKQIDVIEKRLKRLNE